MSSKQSNKRTHKRYRSLQCESLESRQLLTTFTDLTVLGTAEKAQATFTTTPLSSDFNYEIISAGKVQIANSPVIRMADAQFYQENGTLLWKPTGGGVRLLGVPNARYPWTNATTVNSQHTYSQVVRGDDRPLGAYFADKPGSYGDNGGSLKVKIVERSNITLTTDDGFGNPASAPTMIEKGDRGASFLIHRDGGNRNISLKVYFTITGSATYNTDYRVLASSNFKHERGNLFSITFPKQSSSGVVNQTESFFVYALEDFVFEDSELIKVKIEPLNGSSYSPEEKYTSPTNTATVTILNQSHKPDFQPTDVNNTYQVKIGSSTKKGLLPNSTTNFVTTRATDPDSGDVLKYSLVSGNRNYFEVHADTGGVSLKVDAKDLPWHYYSLKIRATDRAGLFTVAQVTTTVVPDVALFGDSMAIEGGKDNINLKVRRFTTDLSKPLTVHYEIVFNHAVKYNTSLRLTSGKSDATDLTLPPKVSNNVYGGTVTIRAGDTSVALPAIKAAADSKAGEGIEGFQIILLPDPVSPGSYNTLLNTDSTLSNYQPADEASNWTPYTSDMDVVILNSVVLFAKNNIIAKLSDTAANGIARNDVSQNKLPNCAWEAAVLAATLRNPVALKAAFETNPTPTATSWKYRVWLYKLNNDNPPTRQKYDFFEKDLLTRGWGTSALTGDDDGKGIEIWTQLLQSAITKHDPDFYPPDAEDFGLGKGIRAGIAYRYLTGERFTLSLVSDTTPEDIKTRLDNGEFLFIGTKTKWANPAPNTEGRGYLLPSTQEIIYQNHTYVAIPNKNMAGVVTSYSLLNPWGLGASDILNLNPSDLQDTVIDFYEHK